MIPLVSHIVSSRCCSAAFVLLCCLFIFTVAPRSAHFLIILICFEVFTAASQHCQQTKEVSTYWAKVAKIWQYKEVWGKVNSFHVQSLVAPLYMKLYVLIPTFLTCPIKLHFWSHLSCLEPFSTMKGITFWILYKHEM